MKINNFHYLFNTLGLVVELFSVIKYTHRKYTYKFHNITFSSIIVACFQHDIFFEKLAMSEFPRRFYAKCKLSNFHNRSYKHFHTVPFVFLYVFIIEFLTNFQTNDLFKTNKNFRSISM